MDGGGCCFPEEIIFEILSRVPAKDLIRFKAVCKPWCFLISDPKFAKSQLHWASRSRAQLEVLFRPVNDYKDSDSRRNTLILYNPVTRQCQNIPRALTQFCSYRFLTALVHDDFIDRYKIFCILSTPKYSAYGTCFIFTVGNDTLDDGWKMFEFESTTKPVSDFNVISPLLFFNNALYWVTLGDEDYVDYEGKKFDTEEYTESLSHYLFSINVAKDTFRKAKIPSSPDVIRTHRRTVASLSKVKGSFCLIVVFDDLMDLRVLEDEANGLWTASYKISLESISIDRFFPTWVDLKNKALKEIGSLSIDYMVYDPYRFHFDSLVTW
ncbi:hypothetical protein AQUCO_01400110v1 [Aquilegia coerulea]|uniref:F-box domain-containing protein n=1 Tax=Aquilegia coerulea TaxID=218851 RepID=A0A2G5DUN0_AQUCA|nr:hypothetical protein AQUCO_01400110v1 [Aquilegia coerulea]